MKRVLAPLLLAAMLAAIAFAGYWKQRPAAAVTIACGDPVAGCAFMHYGMPAQLRFATRPMPLERFIVQIDASGVAHASAQFRMAGMDMGFNHYDLQREGDRRFSAQVTLPACVTGKRAWTLFMELDGARYSLDFTTG